MNASKKTVTISLRKDELDEKKLEKLLDKKGFQMVSLKKMKKIRF